MAGDPTQGSNIQIVLFFKFTEVWVAVHAVVFVRLQVICWEANNPEIEEEQSVSMARIVEGVRFKATPSHL